jgi:predicted dienelactone hydrolase
MRFSILALAAVLAMLPDAVAGPGKTVGFQQVSVPDPEGKPIAMAIWYPSDAPAADSPLGMFSQFVATNAPISGKQLPLILISHGTSGSFASHYDTALALAKAGFVAAAITHTVTVLRIKVTRGIGLI